jgi:hypothetical protein
MKCIFILGLGSFCIHGPFFFSFELAAAEEKELEAPALVANISNTELWCNWAQQTVIEAQQTSKDPQIWLDILRNAQKTLQQCSAQSALANPNHFSDLQKLKFFERELLYWQSQWLISKKADVAQQKICLQNMAELESPAEDQVPLLLNLGLLSSYLEQLQRVYETLDRSPEKLQRKISVPPVFFKISEWSADDCHRAVGILDVALKQLWRPKSEELESTLMPIAQRYEQLKLTRFALELLLLCPEKLRSTQLQKGIQRYQELWQAEKNAQSQEALY